MGQDLRKARHHLAQATSALGPSNRRVNPEVAARQSKHFGEALGQTAREAFRFGHRSWI
jgi:hypothetical protein